MDATKLLVVEDNAVFRKIVTQFLRDAGDFAQVSTADSGQAALTTARTLQPGVVVLDLNLPDTSGFDLMPMLRTAAPDTKIVVLTLWEADAYRRAALAAGADEFVSKSTIHTKLLPAISRVLEPAG
jgi:DNA-binding NarL/FixJ family response regulator